MASNVTQEPATRPEDLGRICIERANAGDVEGLVALYEPDAVLAFPRGKLTVGAEAIRKVYEELLATNPSFEGTPEPAIVNGDLALTSTRIPTGATAEIARRQPDGELRSPARGYPTASHPMSVTIRWSRNRRPTTGAAPATALVAYRSS
jgi:ketosteroid isomerase-like protein